MKQFAVSAGMVMTSQGLMAVSGHPGQMTQAMHHSPQSPQPGYPIDQVSNIFSYSRFRLKCQKRGSLFLGKYIWYLSDIQIGYHWTSFDLYFSTFLRGQNIQKFQKLFTISNIS